MSSRSKHTHLFGLGLVAAALLGPHTARAQAAEGFKLPVEPAPAPPAATTPAPTPAPTPAAEPTVAPVPPADADADADADDTEADATDDGKGHGKHKKKHKKKKHRHDEQAAPAEPRAETSAEPEFSGLVFSSSGGALAIKGRIFALVELSHRNETVFSSSGLTNRKQSALDLSLQSARFGIEYRSPLRWLSVDLELEVAGKPEVKDAYILAGKRFFAKAGQFKVPSAALELESPWALPVARRGFVHDLLADWLDVAGRRPGLALGYRGKGDFKPRLTLGAFQGTTLNKPPAPGDRDVQLIDHASLEAQTFAARAELRLWQVDVGAWYEQRVGSQAVGEFEHFATFGLDAGVDQKFESGALRVWLDGSGGQSLYVHPDKPDQSKDPLFGSGRALLAYRFGGLALGDPYLEPFGFFALLDPDLEVVDDFASEAALGLNAGFWDRAKITLQGEMTSGQRNFPEGFLDSKDPDQLSLLLRAGARF